MICSIIFMIKFKLFRNVLKLSQYLLWMHLQKLKLPVKLRRKLKNEIIKFYVIKIIYLICHSHYLLCFNLMDC